MNKEQVSLLRDLLKVLGLEMPTDAEFLEDGNKELDNLIGKFHTHVVDDPAYDPDRVPTIVRSAATVFYEAMIGEDGKGDLGEQSFYSYLFAVAVWRLVEAQIEAQPRVDVVNPKGAHDD